MAIEFIVVIVAAGLALVPILVVSRNRFLQTALVIGWASLWYVLPPAFDSYQVEHLPVTPTNRPVERTRDGYVGAKECGACHPGEYNSWKHTWHRTMTQVASPESVFGDFNNVDLEWQGWKTRLERRGDKFFAKVLDASNANAGYEWREIVLTTGSHHMQAYWYSRGPEQPLGQLLFTYLKDDQRWVPRDAVFLKPPSLLPSDETGTWNRVCIGCHTTRGRPGLSPNQLVANTDAVEFGISCEACHGPGEAHATTNRMNPVRRYQKHLKGDGDDTIVNAYRIEKERSAEVCGQCHGISTPINQVPSAYESGFDYRAGDVLEETGRTILSGDPDATGAKNPLPPEMRAMFFWPDGMSRPSGREVNGLMESPCYERGEMTCVSCHDMHKSDDDHRSYDAWADDMLWPQMRGNEACIQCHSGFADKVEAHSRHAAGSSGNECMNCHMPYTTWGLLKAIRQHEIDVPSAYTTLAYGRPNACNACHTDQTLGWSAQWLSTWYGQPIPEMTEADNTTAASLRWLLEGDAGQRALAAWYLGWSDAQTTGGTDWIAPHLATLLEDPYDVVRYVAAKSLRSVEGFEDFAYDYVGPEQARKAAKQSAWKLYGDSRAAQQRAQPTLDPARAERLLLFPDGSLDRLAAGKLLQRRDNRSVQIAE